MPATQTDLHPNGLQITFTEEGHEYCDEQGIYYTGATSVIGDFFPHFNAYEVAHAIAGKRNTTPEALMKEWDQNRDDACRYGTRVHENAEWAMKGETRRNQPENEKETIAFQAAADVVEQLKANFSFVAAEKIVFSPRFKVAATVDLLMAQGNKLYIFDYKTNKEIKTKNKYKEHGLEPVRHMEHCETSKYALQLSMIEFIMKKEGYIAQNIEVERAIIHFPHMSQQAKVIPTADVSREVKDILLYHCTCGWDVPF